MTGAWYTGRTHHREKVVHIMDTVVLDGREVSIKDVVMVARYGTVAELAEEAVPRMEASRAIVAR